MMEGANPEFLNGLLALGFDPIKNTALLVRVGKTDDVGPSSQTRMAQGEGRR